MTGAPGSQGNPADEYKDLSDNLRNYANMRFAQLTLFFALTAGLMSILFTQDPPLCDSLRLCLKVVGAITAAAFGVMHERVVDHWFDFEDRAKALEAQLGYRQYTDRRRKKVFTVTNSVRVLVWGAVPIWILSTFLGP